MTTQRDITQRWLAHLPAAKRDQLLQLEPDDLMPLELALDLQMVGVTVTAAWLAGFTETGMAAEYQQPTVLRLALEEWREAH